MRLVVVHDGAVAQQLGIHAMDRIHERSEQQAIPCEEGRLEWSQSAQEVAYPDRNCPLEQPAASFQRQSARQGDDSAVVAAALAVRSSEAGPRRCCRAASHRSSDFRGRGRARGADSKCHEQG